MPHASSDDESGQVYRFGEAELDVSARELRIKGKRATLGPRGVALLRMLIDLRRGAVSKHELLDTVWRGVIVEENNLQVQISTLRKLLGPQAIATIPGRGYRFMLPVEGARDEYVEAQPRPSGHPSEAPLHPASGNAPVRPPELYGRREDCAAVQALLERHPLVSIVGAAGIGKTQLGLAVACALAAKAPDGVWVVEFAPVNDPSILVQTIAQSMKLTLPGMREPVEELSMALRDRHALLLVDNCEHLVEEIGAVLARLLGDSSSLRILTTTQESLRLPNEQIYRLTPLSVPMNAQLADDAMAYGAVRLFVERVRALRPQFSLDASNLPAVVEICRRLDGLPLAIELAAARVPVLGVIGVEERLGERFRVLTGGSRFAPKRHQTLRAALDWSHALLDADERAVYRRLGVFVGSFSLEAAQALAATDTMDEWAVLEHLSSLVEKSLVVAEGEPRPRYRMLESTREHALEQLASSEETDAWIARHAEVTCQSLRRAIDQRRPEVILAEMPNVRSAYEWAFGEGRNAAAAVALATLPSMVIAVEGAVQEARRRLLEVEDLVNDEMPPSLVAQYWQWYGRIGLGGRLPSSHCIEALLRAEKLFETIGKSRHVHACRRHVAEAMLDAGDLAGAANALERAKAMEDASWPVADSMRRLRVEGLWLAKAGRPEEALQSAWRALEHAQEAAIDRYHLVLLDDIARFHLEAGNAHEAADRYRALAESARLAHAGLTLSNALAGLIAALTAENELKEAQRVTQEALPVLARCAILAARADILAWLMARQGHHEAATLLLGASDKFRASCETARDPIENRSRKAALDLLVAAIPEADLVKGIAAGVKSSEDELIASLLAIGNAQKPRSQEV